MNRLAGDGKVQRIAVAALAIGLWSCNGSNPLTIKILSNRADLVSGGQAYIEIVLHPGTSASGLKVEVGGPDVSDAFAMRANGRGPGVITRLFQCHNVGHAN